MTWIGPLVLALITGIFAVIKGIHGTDKPQEDVIIEVKPDLELKEGKRDEHHQKRLSDLGL